MTERAEWKAWHAIVTESAEFYRDAGGHLMSAEDRAKHQVIIERVKAAALRLQAARGT
jgi:hypothetical protein